MTRDFAKQQLARIQAWWPSLPATKEAVNEFVRALGGFTDEEIDKGVTSVIDSHLEQSAPKLGHIIAKVRAARPRTYDTATEEERELYFGAERQARERAVTDELAALDARLAADTAARARYESIMTDLLAPGRMALHAAVLRRTFAQEKK